MSKIGEPSVWRDVQSFIYGGVVAGGIYYFFPDLSGWVYLVFGLIAAAGAHQALREVEREKAVDKILNRLDRDD